MRQSITHKIKLIDKELLHLFYRSWLAQLDVRKSDLKLPKCLLAHQCLVPKLVRYHATFIKTRLRCSFTRNPLSISSCNFSNEDTEIGSLGLLVLVLLRFLSVEIPLSACNLDEWWDVDLCILPWWNIFLWILKLWHLSNNTKEIVKKQRHLIILSIVSQIARISFPPSVN